MAHVPHWLARLEMAASNLDPYFCLDGSFHEVSSPTEVLRPPSSNNKTFASMNLGRTFHYISIRLTLVIASHRHARPHWDRLLLFGFFVRQRSTRVRLDRPDPEDLKGCIETRPMCTLVGIGIRCFRHQRLSVQNTLCWEDHPAPPHFNVDGLLR